MQNRQTCQLMLQLITYKLVNTNETNMTVKNINQIVHDFNVENKTKICEGDKFSSSRNIVLVEN